MFYSLFGRKAEVKPQTCGDVLRPLFKALDELKHVQEVQTEKHALAEIARDEAEEDMAFAHAERLKAAKLHQRLEELLTV
jgi:hypothetical protein